MSPAEHPAADKGNGSLQARLSAIWGAPPGLGQLSAVNHTTVGARIIITGLLFFAIGSVLAMLIRSQLAWSENAVLDPHTFNQVFTMHGTTMMFLFAVPIMEGFAVYLLPKMIGARDLPFPRLGAYGYWCYLFGGVLLFSSFLFDAAPDTGWFMYVPLTQKAFSPGPAADFWLIAITFAEISAVCMAVEIIVAILKTRAPGMSIHRMPLFAWYMLVTAFAIVFAFPPLILGSILLELERAFGFVFFDVARGGDPLLWQHLFWFFGHPEVYIILLPALGVISTIVATFAGRPMVGYTWQVVAAIAIGFISFGLWVHHMFTVGIPALAISFFSAASMAVSIPSGIVVFSLIATLWLGRPVLKTPLLFIVGFFFIFVVGGLTGVMVALVPFDWQVHDTQFVVAHFHYVLIGGMVFPLFAALYYWLPLFSGRLPSEVFGRLAFWLIFIGFNVTFLPMHVTGLVGMPRRVYIYPEGLGWEWLNLVSTLGGFIMVAGIAVLFIDLFLHFKRGRPAGENPWNASTLEWAIPAPVPAYNFTSIPHVEAREPLWQHANLMKDIDAGAYYLASAQSGHREMVGTSAVTAQLEQVIYLPKSSWLPLVAALTTGLFFVSLLAKVYGLALVGVAASAVVFLIWAWTAGERFAPDRVDAGQGQILPTQTGSGEAPGYWGVIVTLFADAALFGALLFAYFFLWLQAPLAWPTATDLAAMGWRSPVLGLITLSVAGALVQWTKVRNARGDTRGLAVGMGLAVVLGVLFIAMGVRNFDAFGVDFREHAYGSLIFTLFAFQFVHVAIAVLMAAFVIARVWRGFVDARRPMEVLVTVAFWRYVVVVWLVSFAAIYLFPLVAR